MSGMSNAAAGGMARGTFDAGHEPPEAIARPRCPNCDKRLRPLTTEEWTRQHDAGGGFRSVVTSRRWLGRYHAYGAFCTLRCCETFANAAFKAGYRIKREAA